MKKLIATMLLALAPLLASASDAGVRFDTVVTEGGTPVASSSVWVPFGKEAVIEIPNKVRVVATAAAPNGDVSTITAKMYYFVNGAWVHDWDASMNADISKTPSFEKDLGDKVHRVVVMPRAASQPSQKGI